MTGKVVLFFWLGSGVLATAMVQTGSRGSLVALVGGAVVFFLERQELDDKA